MNGETGTLRALNPAVYESDSKTPGDAIRGLIGNLTQLAADLDNGRALPQSGAGFVAREDQHGIWTVDLEMTFKIVPTGKH